MAKKITKVKYADLDNDMEMVRFRFRAYRQAMGWTMKDVDAKVGQVNFCTTFERPNGAARLDRLWKSVFVLDISEAYLLRGDIDVLPRKIANKVEAILDVGETVEDSEVSSVLLAAGLDPLEV